MTSPNSRVPSCGEACIGALAAAFELQASNHSIERTSASNLRLLPAAAHVGR